MSAEMGAYPLVPSGGGGSGTYYTDIRLTAETEDNYVAVTIANWYAPVALTITGVFAWCTTAPTGSAVSINLNGAGGTIISPNLDIDANELTSATAATPAVIVDASVAANERLWLGMDAVGSSVPGKGTVVRIIWTEA